MSIWVVGFLIVAVVSYVIYKKKDKVTPVEDWRKEIEPVVIIPDDPTIPPITGHIEPIVEPDYDEQLTPEDEDTQIPATDEEEAALADALEPILPEEPAEPEVSEPEPSTDEPVAPPEPQPSPIRSLPSVVSWKRFFRIPFSLENGLWNHQQIIPQDGIAIEFEIPETDKSYQLKIVCLENHIRTRREGSVGQTPNDYTADPTRTWGLGGGIDCGINYPGQDIDLLPGKRYFSVRNLSPVPSNYCSLRVTLREM